MLLMWIKQDQVNRNHVVYYWKQLCAVGFGCICLFAFEMCERWALSYRYMVMCRVSAGQNLIKIRLYNGQNTEWLQCILGNFTPGSVYILAVFSWQTPSTVFGQQTSEDILVYPCKNLPIISTVQINYRVSIELI